MSVLEHPVTSLLDSPAYLEMQGTIIAKRADVVEYVNMQHLCDNNCIMTFEGGLYIVQHDFHRSEWVLNTFSASAEVLDELENSLEALASALEEDIDECD